MEIETDKLAFIIVMDCTTIFLLALVIILFVITYQRKVVILENNLKIAEQEKHINTFKTSVNVEEKIKEEIARNLHDEINPILNALKFNLSRYRIRASKNEFNPDEIIHDEEILNKAIEGIRSICHDLIPSFFIKYGLIPSLEAHINNLNKTEKTLGKIQNKLSPELIETFTIQDQLNMYRIIMELLNNMIKHAACNHFILELSEFENKIKIQLSHDGKKISNEEIEMKSKNSDGLGLKSLNARLLLLQGDLNYYPSTPLPSVVLLIPLKVVN